MQLLYGNDKIDYRVIAKSPEVAEQMVKELANGGYLFYDYAKGEYSSAEKEPAALCCVFTNLHGMFPEKKLLVSRAGRMANRKTPSYYVHVQMDDPPERLDDKVLEKLLERRFISDREIMDYGEGKKQLAQFHFYGDCKGAWNRDGVESADLRRILHTIFRASAHLGSVVTIVSDEQGDRYNDRAKEILYAVYTRLPYYLRKTMGFTTYYAPGTSMMAGVRVVIVEKGTDIQKISYAVDLNQPHGGQEDRLDKWHDIVEKLLVKDKNTELDLELWEKFLPEGGSAEEYIFVVAEYEKCYRDYYQKYCLDGKGKYSSGCYALLRGSGAMAGKLIVPARTEEIEDLIAKLEEKLSKCQFLNAVQRWQKHLGLEGGQPQMLITLYTKKRAYAVVFRAVAFDGEDAWLSVRWLHEEPQNVLLKEYQKAYAELTENTFQWRKYITAIDGQNALLNIVSLLCLEKFLDQEMDVRIGDQGFEQMAREIVSTVYSTLPSAFLYRWGYGIGVSCGVKLLINPYSIAKLMEKKELFADFEEQKVTIVASGIGGNPVKNIQRQLLGMLKKKRVFLESDNISMEQQGKLTETMLMARFLKFLKNYCEI